MYCSTCGARVPAGRRTCDTCGSPLEPRLRPVPSAAPVVRDAASVPAARHCPRCGYRGEGMPYFSRGAHVAALVGATVLTAGAMGAGGILYYVVRREHLVCPRCGRGWGPHGERAVARARSTAPEPLPPRVGAGEGVKRAWSVLLLLLAGILLIAGIAQFEGAAILGSALAAGGAVLLRQSAARDREARRRALISSLQLPVLQLAARRGGRLTVTEVAAELGWPMPRAEKVLQSLDDGLRVDSEVTDEGVIVYLFRELQLSPGSEGSSGGAGET